MAESQFPFEKKAPLKEVVFHHCNYFGNIKEEKLKISKNWISFKSYGEDGLLNEWDYKTNRESFVESYEDLCLMILEYFEKNKEEALPCDSYSLITIKTNERVEQNRVVPDLITDFINEELLRRIANATIDLVPQNEVYPSFLRHQEVKDLELVAIDKYIDLLAKQKEFEYTEPTDLKPGQIAFCYPIYPDWVEKMIYMFEPDYHYDKHIDALLNCRNNPESLNFNNLRTLFTWLMRGEHFCDGHIATEVKSGNVLKWMKRIKELYLESEDK